MPIRTVFILALATALPLVAARAEDPLFPFVVSYDAPPSIADLSGWLDRPAGKHGFVRVQDGRMVVGDAGKPAPIRFWATNLCFEACFPTHEQADRLAARLAWLGLNCVRMHHMDSHSIWGDSPNKLTIDPKKLDRLDYLIHKLKQHGIYTNINLHVSRWFDKAEGFVARQQRPNYDKGLDNFEPRMIELQKKYARDLLAHVNPYTKTAYVDEPAVAMIEINNENAFFCEWAGNRLDDLPEPYATTYRSLWNAWLRKKYGDTARLRQAWDVRDCPLGDEMLPGGEFPGKASAQRATEQGDSPISAARKPAQSPAHPQTPSNPLPRPWHMEIDNETKAQWSVEPAGPEGRCCLRIVVTRQGRVSWHPQLTCGGLSVKKATPYTLSFFIRSDSPQQINVNCMMNHEPWQRLGFDVPVRTSTDWKQYRRTFLLERDDANARIGFTGLKPGTYELAAVSLRPGGTLGLARDQRLEDDSVPVLRHGDLAATPPARNDFIDFIWDTECDYWHGMYRYLKDELKAKPIVSGTQMGYSPANIQAGLDYIDAHSYWHHPHFPGRPWDPKNWTVRNAALVNTPGGTLSGLAVRRVAGMAYTVSEYNHPEPNVYAAEGFPMIAALGALQAWDGIFNFTYSHNADFEPRRITGFFDIKGVTPRLVHMPACAAMFFRGDVRAARSSVSVTVSAGDEKKKLYETLSPWRLTAGDFGLDPRLALVHRVALDIGRAGDRSATAPPKDLPKQATSFVSDTGQLRWDVSQPDAGYFTADTPRAKLFTGFVRGRTFDLGNIKLTVGPTRLDWATVSMVVMEGEGFEAPGRVLIAATGWTQNRGAELRRLPDNKVTLGNRWGEEPVLCEGIGADLILPVAAGRVQFFPLDESGSRRGPATVAETQGRTLLRLDPKHKTLWYEVQVQ